MQSLPALQHPPVVELQIEIGPLARRESSRAREHEEADVVRAAVGLLDSGQARVAELAPDGKAVVHEWLKKAVLLLVQGLRAIEVTELGPFEYADRLPLKHGFKAAGVRVVPGASARWGQLHRQGPVMMPSYVNIGARWARGRWSTRGRRWAVAPRWARACTFPGGVGIGGVLEPPQAVPVMIGDYALIGSRCMITQGARVGAGAVLGEGCILNPGIPVIDAETGRSCPGASSRPGA